MAGSGRAAGRGLKERLGCGAPPGFLPTFSTFSLLKFVIYFKNNEILPLHSLSS